MVSYISKACTQEVRKVAVPPEKPVPLLSIIDYYLCNVEPVVWIPWNWPKSQNQPTLVGTKQKAGGKSTLKLLS
jgi:hypothetical protein